MPVLAHPQSDGVPRVRAATGAAAIVIDGRLAEPEWGSAEPTDTFLQADPVEGAPVADLFVVYNHNVRSLLDRWQLDSNQLLVKVQYAFRY